MTSVKVEVILSMSIGWGYTQQWKTKRSKGLECKIDEERCIILSLFFFPLHLSSFIRLKATMKLITFLYLHLIPIFFRAFTCSLLCRHQLKAFKFYLFSYSVPFFLQNKICLIVVQGSGTGKFYSLRQTIYFKHLYFPCDCWKGFSLSQSLVTSVCSNS